jgi:glycosyltransferase involved in cell wall biosynthesis
VLRPYAARLVRRPDRLLTYSTAGAAAIELLYGRRADVVPPPIRTGFFTPGTEERTHFLTVARLVAHKRIDVAVEAFRGVDAELVVVGIGPWLERLRARAPRNVRFVGVVSDDRLRELYRGAIAFVSPAPEEFGMAMAEAQACGTPVIAPRAGGALDIVRDGETGMLLDRADPRSIADAVQRAAAFDQGSSERCRASAERFQEERFVAAISQVVDEALAGLSRRPPAELPRSGAADLEAAPLLPL